MCRLFLYYFFYCCFLKLPRVPVSRNFLIHYNYQRNSSFFGSIPRAYMSVLPSALILPYPPHLASATVFALHSIKFTFCIKMPNESASKTKLLDSRLIRTLIEGICCDSDCCAFINKSSLASTNKSVNIIDGQIAPLNNIVRVSIR